MNGIKICVAIPTYNHSERLQEIIDTLPSKMSAIVVDDGSFPPISLKPGSADILRFEKNAGKAEALKAAFRLAQSRGFTHAITIDADGQHPPSMVPDFAAAAEKFPECLILGVRDFDNSAAPPARKYMNKFSNFWFRAETGIKLRDTQCGYRCYPLERISRLKLDFGGFVFEAELLVKAAWAGIGIREIPIPAIYDKASLAGSRYKPIADTAKFAAMNAKLFFASLLLTPEKLKKSAIKE